MKREILFLAITYYFSSKIKSHLQFYYCSCILSCVFIQLFINPAGFYVKKKIIKVILLACFVVVTFYNYNSVKIKRKCLQNENGGRYDCNPRIRFF